MKSGRRDKAEGFVDKSAGRILEAFSKLTGKRSAGAKGKRPGAAAGGGPRRAAQSGGREGKGAAPACSPLGLVREPDSRNRRQPTDAGRDRLEPAAIARSQEQ
jgi:hypothetical protein